MLKSISSVEGDINKAVDFLREAGLAKATKKQTVSLLKGLLMY